MSKLGDLYLKATQSMDAWMHETTIEVDDLLARVTKLETAVPPTPIPPTPTTSLPKYGISCGSRIVDRRTDADQNFELDQCKSIGAKVVRVDCWRQGETLTNVVVDKILARQMQPFICLGGTERDWSSTRLNGYTGWWGAQAQRWKGRNYFYEIFNEPDLNGGTPELYVPLVKQAYQEIKAVDSTATVVAGALWKWDNGPTANPTAGVRGWVDRMYKAGVKGYFDLLSLHLYDDPAEHGSWSLWDQAFVNSPCVRSIMDSNGDQAKKIISSESGGGIPHYTASKQATIVTNAIGKAKDGTIGSCFVYTMLDDDVPGFGLLDANRVKRPSWDAYKAAAV